MYKYDMDQASIVEDTDRTRFRQTNGQRETSIPHPLPTSLKWVYNDMLKAIIRCRSKGVHNGAHFTHALERLGIISDGIIELYIPEYPGLSPKTKSTVKPLI